MCSPIIQAAGQIAQGISDYNTGKAQAKMATYEGNQALEAANYQAGVIRRQGAEVQGANTVAAAGAGVDVSSGSVLDIAAKNARDNELDALMATQKGLNEKWSKGVEAKMAKYQGKMSLINSGFQAAGTLGKAAADTFPKTFGG